MAERPFDIAVFDFDGTLVQSNPVKAEGFEILARRYPGGPEALAQIGHETGLDRFQITKRLAESLGMGPEAGQALAQDYTQITDDRVVEVPECTGATELLAALRGAGIAVHLSSATPLTSLKKIIVRRGWTEHFDGLHGRPTPKIETLDALMAETGVPADRIAVIGDGPDDRDSAAARGTGFFAVGDRLTDSRLYSLAEVQAELVG